VGPQSCLGAVTLATMREAGGRAIFCALLEYALLRGSNVAQNPI